MAYNKSYFHRGGENPLRGQTIPEHFTDIVSRFPNHEALVCIPQHQRLTYSELFWNGSCCKWPLPE
jgi:fatty-acyl-CoA synthase